MRACCIKWCKNSSRNTGENFSFFYFPKDPVLAKIWQERTCKERLRKHSTVCEHHFDIGDVRGSGRRKTIRKGALPLLCREPSAGAGQGRLHANTASKMSRKRGTTPTENRKLASEAGLTAPPVQDCSSLPEHDPDNLSCDMCAYKAVTSTVLRLHREHYHFKRNPGLIRKDGAFDITNTSDRSQKARKKPKKLSEKVTPNPPYQQDCSTPASQPKLGKPRKSNTKDKTFTCNQCNFAFTREGHLKRHKAARHEGVIYHCEECEYTASRSYYVKQHKEAVHQGMRYSCDRCNFRTPSAYSLKRHNERKHIELSISSENQEKQIPVIKEVPKSHQEVDHHSNMQEKNTEKLIRVEESTQSQHDDPCNNSENPLIFENNSCEDSMPLKGSDQVSCDPLEVKFQSPDVFKLLKEDDQLGQNPGLAVYSCVRCKYRTKSFELYKLHIKATHMNKSYTCDQCEFTADTKATLKLHKKSTHDEGMVYSCDQCWYFTERQYQLIQHQQSRHGIVQVEEPVFIKPSSLSESDVKQEVESMDDPLAVDQGPLYQSDPLVDTMKSEIKDELNIKKEFIDPDFFSSAEPDPDLDPRKNILDPHP